MSAPTLSPQPLSQCDLHTTPTCPHCGRNKSRPAAPTCQPCWKALPIPLRSALLRTRSSHGIITDLPSYQSAFNDILTHLATHSPARN